MVSSTLEENRHISKLDGKETGAEMANIRINQLKKGQVINYQGDLHKVLEIVHVTPGKGAALYHVKLRNLAKGNTIPARFSPSESVDVVYLDTRKMQYLYKDGNDYVFMDTETYEQINIPADFLGDDALYLVENMEVLVTFHEDKPIGVELPTTVELEVTETEAATKGDTVNNVLKEAVCETGLKVKVPLFVQEGDKIKVDTRTGEFLQRITQ